MDRAIGCRNSFSRTLGGGNSDPAKIDHNEGYDANHSPLWYLLASLPLLGWTGTSEAGSFHYWGWLARLPYLIFGVLLGASLWYVAADSTETPAATLP